MLMGRSLQFMYSFIEKSTHKPIYTKKTNSSQNKDKKWCYSKYRGKKYELPVTWSVSLNQWKC